ALLLGLPASLAEPLLRSREPALDGLDLRTGPVALRPCTPATRERLPGLRRRERRGGGERLGLRRDGLEGRTLRGRGQPSLVSGAAGLARQAEASRQRNACLARDGREALPFRARGRELARGIASIERLDAFAERLASGHALVEHAPGRVGLGTPPREARGIPEDLLARLVERLGHVRPRLGAACQLLPFPLRLPDLVRGPEDVRHRAERVGQRQELELAGARLPGTDHPAL